MKNPADLPEQQGEKAVLRLPHPDAPFVGSAVNALPQPDNEAA
jgi:hypothetical protein